MPLTPLSLRAPASAGTVLVLRRGERAVVLGPVDRGDRCGLGLVDDLLRLQVAVGRFGWELHLAHVPQEVAELLELVGLPVDPGGGPLRR